MNGKFRSFALAAALALVPSVAGVATPAAAVTPDSPCSGTVTAPCLFQGFEIDGNTAADAGGIDWTSSAVAGSPALNTLTDPTNSTTDNVFTAGNDTNQNSWACGKAKPAGKDDIGRGAIWFQTVNGVQYLYGSFSRYAANGADAHVDFEFNRSTNAMTGTCAGLPVRENGDILIALDTHNGGATITVTAFKWANGSWNSVATANQFAGLANISPARTDAGVPAGAYGEAGLDLTDTVGTMTCGMFGAAWMKTREATTATSDVTDNTAALEDYTAPRPINMGNCPTSSLVKGVRNITTNNPSDGSYPTSVNASVGNQIGYKLTYTNSGPGTAHDVMVTDPIPAHSTFTSCSDGCTTNAGTITWPTVPSVAPGGSLTYTFTVTLDSVFPQGTTLITNIGRVMTTEEPWCIYSNQATVHVGAKPSLHITKTADYSSVSPGTTIGYTIKATNTGSADATNVIITDTLPTSGGEKWSISPANSSCSITSGVLTCNVGTLVARIGSFSVHITSPTSQATCGTVSNMATVTADGGLSVTSGSPEGTPTIITVSCPTPHLTITKVADNNGVANDTDTIGYTITATNGGTADATNVKITDDLTQTGLTWTPDGPSASACSITGGVMTCTVGTLVAHGGSFSVHISAKTTSQTCGTINNVATVTADGGLSVKSGSPAGTPTPIVVNCAKVTITKVADSATVTPGQPVGYKLTVHNKGAGVAYNVKVTDTLPNGFAGLKWSMSPAVPGCSISNANPQVLTCTFATVAANDASPIVIHVVSATPATACGLLSNQASVTSDNGGGNTTGVVVITVPLATTGASTHGSAYGLDVSALGIHLINQVGAVSTSAPPNGDPVAKDLVTIPSIMGVVSANIVNNTSTSHVNDESVSTATSTIAHINLLGGAIKADAIKAVSQSTASGTTASYNSTGSTFLNLVVNGNTLLNVAPNTKVTVYVPGTTIKLASVVLNEKSGTSGLSNGMWSASQSTTMIDVTLLAPLGTLPAGAHILVAHAQTDAKYPSALGCQTTASTVSGNAYVAYANGTLANTTLVNAQVGDAELPPTGGSDSDSIANVAVAPLVVGGVGVDYTNGQTTSDPITATSGSNLANVNVLNGLITANAIDVKASSTATHTTASTTFGATCANGSCTAGCNTSSPCFVNLSVNGTKVVGIDGGTVAPNTTIAIPQPDGSLIEVILNEQITSNTGGNTEGDINAIHVYVLKGNGSLNAEVIVGHAHSDAHHI